MKSVAGGVTTYYVHDLVEYSNGVLTTFYVSGDGQRVAQRVGSAAPTYLLVDHLGSTRYVLDNSAQTLSAQRYFPWGSTHFASDASTLPRRAFAFSPRLIIVSLLRCTSSLCKGNTALAFFSHSAPRTAFRLSNRWAFGVVL